jgi:1-aminocyclopropane-1-carboxylate deaminase
MMSQLKLPPARIDPVNLPLPSSITLHVLRLDEIDPLVSGNKWYKLKEYLADAAAANKKIILTFGGAYSNHILATAAACKKAGLTSIGIIRGEEAPVLSHTLRHAVELGMKLLFVSREDYKEKKIPPEIYGQFDQQDVYIINEGGYGFKGAQGAMAILQHQDPSYTHIVTAVGTGTTLAGLARASHESQSIIGIPVMKNNFSLQGEIEYLLCGAQQNFSLLNGFHFGGYAKFIGELIRFMISWYEMTGIPSDFVYTGKMFFAADQLIRDNYFPAGSKILLIHSGGLQGNGSLPKGTLIF